jgi:hypothetical protein
MGPPTPRDWLPHLRNTRRADWSLCFMKGEAGVVLFEPTVSDNSARLLSLLPCNRRDMIPFEG